MKLNTPLKTFLFWMVVGIILGIVVMEIRAYMIEKKRGKSEKSYLPGPYYLTKQAQPDPYPNFPGSIV